jgi:hypothetical protein
VPFAETDPDRGWTLTHITPRRPSFSTLVGTLAVLMLLASGGAYAAAQITGKQIKNSSVTGKDIKDGSLTGKDVKDESLTAADLAPSAAGNSELAANAVTAAKILDGTITTADLGTGSVTGSTVLDDSLGAADILDASLTGADVQDESLTGADIENNSVGPDDVSPLHGDIDIQDNTISTFDIATNAIDSDEVLDFGLSNQDIGVLFAQVNGDGTVANSSGSVSVAKLGAGSYEVDFGRDISNCAFFATQGEATPGGAPGAIMGATDRSGNANAAFVTARTDANVLADRAFQLMVVC